MPRIDRGCETPAANRVPASVRLTSQRRGGTEICVTVQGLLRDAITRVGGLSDIDEIMAGDQRMYML